MSEVTELTNEQAREMLRKYSVALQAYAVADAGSEAERIADEESDRLEVELLRRLSTQGAGPRPKEIRKWLTDNYPDISPNEHVDLIAMLSNFGSEFFRAPSDPPRLEARKPEPLGFCIGARCPGCAQCDK